MNSKTGAGSYFDFQPNDIITEDHVRALQVSKPLSREELDQGFRGGEEVTDISKQFLVFQLTDEGAQEPSQITPSVPGSQDLPDMRVGVSLEGFQCPSQQGFSSATLRFTMGKDPSSSDRIFDTAFWCIAAGLQLYQESQGKTVPASGKELRSDFQQAFGKRPIEIPGGLAVMSFEVVRHKPEAWWQKVFTFLQSSTGKTLVSTLGFPALANSAISVIDELMNRVVGTGGEAIFKSRPLTLALSKYARDNYTGGNSNIAVGTLNPGWALLARGGDFKRIASNTRKIRFYPHLGIIAPSDTPVEELISNPQANEFADLTYGVLKVGMQSTKLDPTFNFR
jgi:hypothetical protein